jgi:hypothetical protein
MSIVGQPRDLPQPQLPVEEADSLVVESVLDTLPVDSGRAQLETMCSYLTTLSLAVGQDAEPVLDHLLEKGGIPGLSGSPNGKSL